MRRFFLLLSLFLVIGVPRSAAAQCYLSVENSGYLDTKAISQISLVQISKNFEPVNEIPPEGISSDVCLYKLSVSELANGILVTVKGRKASTYGESKLRGFDGFHHALFRAIISAKPEQKQPICEQYYTLMGADCSGVIVAPPTQPPSKGKLIVRVPKNYRFSQIFSDGKLLGDMQGEEVRDFDAETGTTLALKAVDGEYQSEKINTIVQIGESKRVEFKNFKSRQIKKQPIPEPQKQKPAVSSVQKPKGNEKQFAETGAIVFGISVTPAFMFENQDTVRNTSGNYQGVDFGIGADLFFDWFITKNFGIGLKSFSVSAENISNYYYTNYKTSIASLLYTASLWFPIKSGYGHIGLTGGTGSSTYDIEYSNGGTINSKYEAEGSATTFGFYFDWGGDEFGGRIGYHSISTTYDTYKNTGTGRVYQVSSLSNGLDGSGSGFYASMRWGF